MRIVIKKASPINKAEGHAQWHKIGMKNLNISGLIQLRSQNLTNSRNISCIPFVHTFCQKWLWKMHKVFHTKKIYMFFSAKKFHSVFITNLNDVDVLHVALSWRCLLLFDFGSRLRSPCVLCLGREPYNSPTLGLILGCVCFSGYQHFAQTNSEGNFCWRHGWSSFGGS